MNKLLRKIENQAVDTFSSEMGGTYRGFSKEKFAELIIKEYSSLLRELDPNNKDFDFAITVIEDILLEE